MADGTKKYNAQMLTTESLEKINDLYGANQIFRATIAKHKK